MLIFLPIIILTTVSSDNYYQHIYYSKTNCNTWELLMEWREPFHCWSSSYTPHQRYHQNSSGFYYTFHVIFSSIPTCGGSLDTNGVTLTCAKTCAKVWSKFSGARAREWLQGNCLPAFISFSSYLEYYQIMGKAIALLCSARVWSLLFWNKSPSKVNIELFIQTKTA